MLCVDRYRSLRRADHSSIPTECGVSECDHVAPNGQAMTRNRVEALRTKKKSLHFFFGVFKFVLLNQEWNFYSFNYRKPTSPQSCIPKTPANAVPLKGCSVVWAVCLPRVKAEINGSSLDPSYRRRKVGIRKMLTRGSHCHPVTWCQADTHNVSVVTDRQNIAAVTECVRVWGRWGGVKQVRKYTFTVYMTLFNVTWHFRRTF